MRNYIKSEWYRVTHASTIYMFTGVLAVLALLVNLVLWFLDKVDPTFPHGTAAFSLSNLVCMMTMLFYVGMILVYLIFI